MDFALIPTTSVRRTLDELDIARPKKGQSAAITTVVEVPSGFVRRFPDGITVYGCKSHKLLMVPAGLVSGEYRSYTQPGEMRKRYFGYVVYARRTPGCDPIADALIADVRANLPRAVWDWSVDAVELGEPQQMAVDVRGRKGLVEITMQAHLLLPAGSSGVASARARMGPVLGARELVRLDADAIFRLCQNKLDIHHLLDELAPTPQTAVLLVLAKESDTIVGIRATRISWGTKRKRIHGIYACSSGFGTHIQAYSEELLRTHLAPTLTGQEEGYGTSAYLLRTRPSTAQPTGIPAFTLHAIPSAAPVWKSAFGFQDTQKKKGALSLLTKMIRPPSEEETTRRTKRKASKSASPASATKS